MIIEVALLLCKISFYGCYLIQYLYLEYIEPERAKAKLDPFYYSSVCLSRAR